MNANDVWIDVLEDNRKGLHGVLGEIQDACLHWTSDPGANSIAVTVWHMGRIMDVLFIQQMQGKPAGDECWFKGGWVARTGYDPRGVGTEGWGAVHGYTAEEVAAIPRIAREDLLGYTDEVYDMAKTYLGSTESEALLTPAAGFGGELTKYQCIQIALLDNVRHLGEILALKAMWERRYL
jgi:hypothetical protein